MTLTLFYHPLASFCHKVLVALYEAGATSEGRIVDLANPGDHGRFLDLWPVGKMPVLHDGSRDATIPESSIIIEYLDRHHPGAEPMLPADPDQRLEVRLWDRFFDLHAQDPMQRIVFDRLRPHDQKSPAQVAEAEQRLATAYDMIERRMAGREWPAGDKFSLADCAAAPAFFFAGIIVPFGSGRRALDVYFERLLERPSFRRVLVEAQPYFEHFPLRDRMPDCFVAMADA